MDKLVSIVLPVYNGEKYLAESIESVLKQTYKSFELIIVNDCSTDSSEDIILKYKAQDSRIIYIKNEVNSKLPKSLNNGFRIAKGEYYTWTSDDNMYRENAIEEMVCFLDTNADVALVYCDMKRVKENGDLIDEFVAQNKEKLIYRNIVGACFMYRSYIAKKIGGYREDMFLAEDYEYWLRISMNYEIAPLNKCLYEYRCHGSNLSNTQGDRVRKVTGLLQWEYLRRYEKKPIDEEELFKYFEYILMYKRNTAQRILIEFIFACKHKKYFRKIIFKMKDKLIDRAKK